MEDPGISKPQLLVATDVLLHWSICVKTCDLCLRTKVQHQPPIRELAPLPVPEFCWDTISIDFIVELPEAHGYDAVINVVDSVSKMSHFIPTHTMITALGVARLFLTHVWKLHGLPRQVVSDRGPQFIAEFTWELYQLLRVKLAATTTYHPQGDRRMEQVSQPRAGAIPLTLCK